MTVSTVLWPAVSVAAENTAVAPAGTPATVSVVKFVNPPLPVRAMLNATLPTAGTPAVAGNAESWKSCVGITTKEPVEVAVPDGVVTEIGPVVALEGTAAVIEDALFTVKEVEATPLNFTDCTVTKFAPVMVTWSPTCPLVGENPMIEGPVIVSVLLAGWRIGAMAVIVTMPALAPVTANVVLLWPSRLTTVSGIVTLPLPDCDRVTVKTPASPGLAEVTVMVKESPARNDAVAGVRLSAGGVRTVSVALALIEPEVAVMVVVPAARADTTPLALIVATV